MSALNDLPLSTTDSHHVDAMHLGVLPSREPWLVPCGGDKLDIIAVGPYLDFRVRDVQLGSRRPIGRRTGLEAKLLEAQFSIRHVESGE